MDNKDIDSKVNSIAESIEAQFDDLFAPKKTDNLPDAGKKSPAPDTSTIKDIPQKETAPNPINNKVTQNKDPVTGNKPFESTTSIAKSDRKEFSPNNTLIEKRAASVQEGESRPPVKESAAVPEKKTPAEDTDQTTVVNVFKKANEKYKKVWLWEKARQVINPLIFVFLILFLVILSVFNGMIMDSDGLPGFFKMKKLSASVPQTVIIERSDVQKVNASEELEASLPEDDIESTKNKDSDIQDEFDVEEKKSGQAETDTVLPVKTPNEDPDAVQEVFMSYPYSVYLGSYNSVEKVEAVSSPYREKGIASYWIKLDLKDKGVWYRLFVGYFQSREEADKFIKTGRIKEAESKLTKYSILVGIYRSRVELDSQKARLEELGYSPYIIRYSKDAYRLYTGAFYQMSRAEELKNDLEVNGFMSEIVER